MFRLAQAASIVALFSASLSAQDIVRIEEDWELHVQQPDDQIDAPQVSTMMLPAGGNSDLLFQVHLNHSRAPDFTPGGFQVRAAWDTETISQWRSNTRQRFTDTAETVTWTQVVKQTQNGFSFGVQNGQSTSWGVFGGPSNSISISHEDAGTSTLNHYSIGDSLDNSGASYAANRVGWLKLKRVRLTTSHGQTIEMVVNEQVE